jgi:hypothetical protein
VRRRAWQPIAGKSVYFAEAYPWELAMKPDRDPRPGLPSAQERSRTSEPLRRKPEPRRVDLESIRRVVRNLDDPEE